MKSGIPITKENYEKICDYFLDSRFSANTEDPSYNAQVLADNLRDWDLTPEQAALKLSEIAGEFSEVRESGGRTLAEKLNLGVELLQKKLGEFYDSIPEDYSTTETIALQLDLEKINDALEMGKMDVCKKGVPPYTAGMNIMLHSPDNPYSFPRKGCKGRTKNFIRSNLWRVEFYSLLGKSVPEILDINPKDANELVEKISSLEFNPKIIYTTKKKGSQLDIDVGLSLGSAYVPEKLFSIRINENSRTELEGTRWQRFFRGAKKVVKKIKQFNFYLRESSSSPSKFQTDILNMRDLDNNSPWRKEILFAYDHLMDALYKDYNALDAQLDK